MGQNSPVVIIVYHHHRVGSGGWSSEGIQVISSVTGDNVTTVVFNSTHLTSFAVLVDVAGGLEVYSSTSCCYFPEILRWYCT